MIEAQVELKGQKRRERKRKEGGGGGGEVGMKFIFIPQFYAVQYVLKKFEIKI